MEANHKRKRRKEARAQKAQRDQLELQQPDMIRQPMAFSTNAHWAEEITAGPGPPKGWRRDSMSGGLAKDASKIEPSQSSRNKGKQKSVFAQNPTTVSFLENRERASSTASEPGKRRSRPSLDQKQSALDTFKDTLLTSLRPEGWNRRRYEREDEPLWGLNDAMSRMWDRARPSNAKRASHPEVGEHRRSLSRGRKRSGTTDSDQYDYSRARNPAVNDLHPPVVSQLPATRAEVAWMLQPPPSRAVMEGKIRPGDEDMSRRKPLAIIGSSKEEDERRSRANDRRGITERLEPRPEQSKQRPPVVVVSDDGQRDENEEYGDTEEEPDTEEASPTNLKSTRSASLPFIDYTRSTSKSRSLKENSPSSPQRPPLAVIASTKTGSVHSFTLSAPSPRLNSRSASPVSMYSNRSEKKPPVVIDVPPEWDYLLEILPKVPPRTRTSLPNGVWA